MAPLTRQYASAGLQKWRKNLQLLVPFLTEPRIDLISLSELDASALDNDSAQRLKVGCTADLEAILTTHECACTWHCSCLELLMPHADRT